jgi:hypothetical protein
MGLDQQLAAFEAGSARKAHRHRIVKGHLNAVVVQGTGPRGGRKDSASAIRGASGAQHRLVSVGRETGLLPLSELRAAKAG